jgi:transposase InsO family protein
VPELADFEVFAGDGHFHAAAAHDPRDAQDGSKDAVGHFFALDLRSHALGHLTAADQVTRRKEHDMHALTREGWLYLAVVIDLFSRSILGWKLADSLHTEVVTGALHRALDTGIVAPDALFHSDRGCQYSAAPTRALLAHHHLRQSMSAAGCCYDNAFAESAFASLKSELLDDGAPFRSKPAATTAVFDYLETFYNRKRRHSSLAYQSPQAFLHSYFQNQKLTLN